MTTLFITFNLLSYSFKVLSNLSNIYPLEVVHFKKGHEWLAGNPEGNHDFSVKFLCSYSNMRSSKQRVL